MSPQLLASYGGAVLGHRGGWEGKHRLLYMRLFHQKQAMVAKKKNRKTNIN